MASILVVDDEHHIAELLKYHLEKEYHQVFLAYDGLEALKMFKSHPVDLVILDVMLPGVDGLAICQEIRKQAQDRYIPIIMLSAKDELLDRVLGLELGADDYVAKPFSIREFMARVRARLRRLEEQEIRESDKVLTAGPVTINCTRYEAYSYEQKVDLTRKEFELLNLLISFPRRVFTRENLLERIWGIDGACDTRTVDVHIHHLRQKIEKGNGQLITTVRGFGYKYDPSQ